MDETLNKKVYFVSDIHFGGQDPEAEREKKETFFALLDEIKRENGVLVILGDLFDLWFEYRHAIPKEHAEVVGKLFEAVRGGMEIHFVLGNHDFWIGDFFAGDLGIKVYPDPVTLTFGGKRFHLHHGDGVAGSDVGYRFLKKVFRFKPNIFLYRWLHPDIGLPFAKFISGSSRKYTSQKEMSFDPDYTAYAEKALKEADYVLMGHRHQPEEKKLDNGIYINTGDWMFNRSYALFEGDKLSLKYYGRRKQDAE